MRLSDHVASPLVAGVWRPVVLVPALVERCFFFHPLARLAAREYAFWREAACDEAVLVALGTSPQRYGCLLLALGVSRPPATFAAAGAAWSFDNLKRRITMLSHPSPPSLGGRVLAAGAVALAVLAVAPVRAVARTADPVAAVTRGPAARVTATAPAPTAAPVTATAARPTPPSAASPVRVPPARTERLDATVSGLERADRAAASADGQRQEALRFVYIRDDDHTMMSGESGDAARARRFRRSGEPMLWLRQDGQEYVVRDRDVLRDVDELWHPVSRIGGEQGRLGARQGELGAEQGRRGAKQGEVGARQGRVGARQGVVAARLGLLAAREAAGVSASERRDMDREREALDRDMRQLEREMASLNEEMRDVEPPRRGIDEEMARLGREMGVLGRQMEDASRRAHAAMRTLVARAIRSGAAEPVR